VRPHRSAPAGRPLAALGSAVRSPTLLAYLLLLIIIGTLFGSSMLGIDRLAFRDGSHFYTPLYRYVAARERMQWLPLYNPLDVAGMSLSGETTTAVFYPLRRVVYWLVPSAESAMAWYVAVHLVLAAATIHFAALTAGARRRGRAVAILAYPLSGPVLFLYCNPVFLVGAAWAPLALAGGTRLLKRFSGRDLAITATGLAMPILGGDPQIAIHIMLVGLAALVWACVMRPAAAPWSLMRLSSAAILACLLASPQIAASADWARQSDRYAAATGAQREETYHFSVAPWHWLELAAPSISGRIFPAYTRVSHLVPADGRTWAITLYSGLLPLCLAAVRYGSRRRKLDLWDALAPVGLLLALGGFGFGYLLKNVLPFVTWQLEDAAGGPYWWLVNFMPGYAGFRYPAKWLVFVPLGIAIAAARQGSLWSPRRSCTLAQASVAVAATGLTLAALVVIALRVTASRSPAALAISDTLWGPLQWQLAADTIATSALVVTSIAAAVFVICRAHVSSAAKARWLLVLLAFDLAIVAWPTVATVNRAAEVRLMAIAQGSVGGLTTGDGDAIDGRRGLRFTSNSLWPRRWRQMPSAGKERMLAVEASMRNTRYGRWHLMDDRPVFNPMTSLPPHRGQSFWSAANTLARQQKTREAQVQYWNRVISSLAVGQTWSAVPYRPDSGAVHASTNPHSDLLALQVQPTPHAAEHILWFGSYRAIAAQRTITADAFAARLSEIAAGDAAPPLIEMPHADLNSSELSRDAVASEHAPSVVAKQLSPEHWTITVDSPASGIVCIKQFQDGNWRAEVSRINSDHPAAVDSGTKPATSDTLAEPATVYRCDYLFSAVMAPAGTIQIVLKYQPPWLGLSLAVAAAAWLVATALLFTGRRDAREER
jgi:hypothetical protein